MAAGRIARTMLADPALDLSSPVERAEQVDRWLNQLAADAGLLGMAQLVAEARAAETFVTG